MSKKQLNKNLMPKPKKPKPRKGTMSARAQAAIARTKAARAAIDEFIQGAEDDRDEDSGLRVPEADRDVG